MLDIKLIRERPDFVKGELAKRGIEAAEVFAKRYRADETEMRFDIVAIDASGKRLEIELLRNAF